MLMKVVMKMSRKLIFNDTVTLFNYVGEVNGVATYAKAILHDVKFVTKRGRSTSGTGSTPDNSATLYIFDTKARVTDVENKCKTYLTPEAYERSDNPYPFFTFRSGKDFVVNGVCEADSPKMVESYRITLASRNTSGTRRMYHWRCDCR